MRKRASFLTADEPKALLNVMRKRKVEALQVRRANALVALDDGHSVQMVSRIFYLDPDTVRGWLGISEQTYYRWRREYGGLKIDQARRLKELEQENTRLKKAVADLTVDKMILAAASKGNL